MPEPRPEAATERSQGNGASASRRAKGNGPAKGRKVPGRRTGPTLVSLVGEFLDQNSGPHLAAEITTALSQGHPDRKITAPLVRNAVEGLVAKGQANRTKQGSSVFYTQANDKPAKSPESVSA